MNECHVDKTPITLKFYEWKSYKIEVIEIILQHITMQGDAIFHM